MKTGYDHQHSDELEIIDLIPKGNTNISKFFAQAASVYYLRLAYSLYNICDGNKVDYLCWIERHSICSQKIISAFGLCDNLYYDV